MATAPDVPVSHSPLPPSTSSIAISTDTFSLVPSSAVCHLLSVPLETRRNIYRFLLLEPPCMFLDPNYRQHSRKAAAFSSPPSCCDSDESASNSSDTDETTSDNGRNQPTYIIASETTSLVAKGDETQESLTQKLTPATPQRTPAILQANRQIYDEASSLLYSRLQLVIRPRDIVTEPATGAVKLAWHRLESHGPERKNVNGLTTCGRDVDRVMEPEVFTRFERVRYEAHFSFSDDYLAPTMSIDKDLLDTHFKYGTGCHISATEVIQTFVDLLSTSPLITFLEISLSVETYPSYDFDEDSDDDCFLGNNKQDVENDKAVSTRYYELFLESGVLEPLKQLTNVRCFALDSALVSSLRQRNFLEPRQKHLDLMNNLKAVIENNWVGGQTRTAAVGVRSEDQSASHPGR